MLLDLVMASLPADELIEFFIKRFEVEKPEASTYEVGQAIPPKINDVDILMNCLPDGLFSEMMDSGYVGFYALTFALRFRITAISIFLHKRSLALRSLDEAADPGLVKLSEMFEEDFELLEEAVLKLEKSKEAPPIIGFSPLGCHWIASELGSCRAFDIHECNNCTNKAEFLFCEEHQKEAWWNIKEPHSTQAKMFEFHHDHGNFEKYDEDDLAGFVKKFWDKYNKMLANYSPDRLEKALKRFALADIDGLIELGEKKLRKRFLVEAKTAHPDVGGNHEKFIDLRDDYEVLKNILLNHQTKDQGST